LDVAWDAEYTDEFGAWWATLGEGEQDAVDRVVGLLEERGPFLGHPYSSDVKGSRHGHLRELRASRRPTPCTTSTSPHSDERDSSDGRTPEVQRAAREDAAGADRAEPEGDGGHAAGIASAPRDGAQRAAAGARAHAGVLETTQPEVSKIERRADMYLSTLRGYIEALGGELEIRAKFPDGEVRIVQLGDLAEPARSTAQDAEPAGAGAARPGRR
jgi:hypothetical protein